MSLKDYMKESACNVEVDLETYSLEDEVEGMDGLGLDAHDLELAQELYDVTMLNAERLQATVESILEADQGSLATMEMINQTIEAIFSPVMECSTEKVSVEHFHEDWKTHHEVALEDLRDKMNLVTQGFALSWSRFSEKVQDAFEDAPQQVSRVRGDLGETQRRYKDLKSRGIEDSYVGSLKGLIHLFVTEKGFVKDLPKAVAEDTDYSSYALTEYIKAYQKELKGFIAAIKGADFSSKESVEKTLLADLLKVKSAGDLFDVKYLTSRERLLGSNYVKRVLKKPPQAAEEGKGYIHLADLARINYINQGTFRIARNVLVGATAIFSTPEAASRELENIPTIEVTDKEYHELFDHVDIYLSNLSQFHGLKAGILKDLESLDDAMVGLKKKELENPTPSSAVYKQVKQAADNYRNVFYRLTAAEHRRSMRLAKGLARFLRQITKYIRLK